MSKFKVCPCSIMIGFLIVFSIFYFVSEYRDYKIKESFWTSPGTLVQLQTSHVPTEEDLQEMQRERRRIHRDLLDLTGSP